MFKVHHGLSLSMLAGMLALASPAAASEGPHASAELSVGAFVIDCATVTPNDKLPSKTAGVACTNEQTASRQVRRCSGDADYVCASSEMVSSANPDGSNLIYFQYF